MVRRVEVPRFDPARLRKHRQRAGLSQERMAVLLGVPRTQVVAWETGRRGLSLRHLRAIAGHLGIQPVELLHPEEAGETLRPLRENAGLSQLELAGRLQVNLRTYRRLETGTTRTLSDLTASQLATHLAVDEDRVRRAHARAHRVADPLTFRRTQAATVRVSALVSGDLPFIQRRWSRFRCVLGACPIEARTLTARPETRAEE